MNFYTEEEAERAASLKQGFKISGVSIKTKGPRLLSQQGHYNPLPPKPEGQPPSTHDYRPLTDCSFFVVNKKCKKAGSVSCVPRITCTVVCTVTGDFFEYVYGIYDLYPCGFGCCGLWMLLYLQTHHDCARFPWLSISLSLSPLLSLVSLSSQWHSSFIFGHMPPVGREELPWYSLSLQTPWRKGKERRCGYRSVDNRKKSWSVFSLL